MSTQNDVNDNWQERRELVLNVRTRVYDQLLALKRAVDPAEGPDEEQQMRMEDLRFELGQLQQAFDEADQNWLTYSLGSDQNGVER